ncbi:UNVERIFIED_CONTAM: hypothetical protein GTU68_046833 [Idotea baltica]|nr:hypothetical protein [Idotea baltica]
MSNCAMRVRLQLEEKKIPWVDRFVDLRAQKNLTEEYFKIHPKGLVPAIIHDGTIVYESSDILVYIEEKFPETPLIPSDPAKKAEMQYWLNWFSVNHLPVIKTWAYGRNNKPTKTKESMAVYETLQKDQELLDFHRMTLSEGAIPEEKILKAQDLLFEAFSKVDKNLATSEYVLGDKVSLADIAWIPQYPLLMRNDFPFEKFPNYLAWIERWKKRPSYKEAISKWVAEWVPGAV